MIRARSSPAFTLCVTAALTAACWTPEAESESGVSESQPVVVDRGLAEVSVVRGFLVLGPEVRSIKPCEEEDEWWVIPTPRVTEVYEALGGGAYEAVFVEVDATRGPPPASGFGADFAGLLTMRELRRAEPADEGFGCTEDLSTFEFRASGEEPFWHLRVTPQSMTLSTPAGPEASFEAAAAAMAAGGWTYSSESTGPEAVSIIATFRPDPCTDSMSGAVYSWTAEVTVGTERRVGCAWQGALAPR